jgi:hypothetical protein
MSKPATNTQAKKNYKIRFDVGFAVPLYPNICEN